MVLRATGRLNSLMFIGPSADNAPGAIMHPLTVARPSLARRPSALLGAFWAGAMAAAVPIAPLKPGPTLGRPAWTAVAQGGHPTAGGHPAGRQPAAGGHPAAPTSRSAAEEGTATAVGVKAFGQGEVPASEESSNWSGYEETGAGAQFTSVSASWAVPQLEANITGSSSAWVGIDGTTTPDLIQAGTEQDWTVSGPLYYAWYELLPGSAVELGPVHPGDEVTASVAQLSPGKWSISIKDSTTGQSWSQQVAYNAAGVSAEWVVEAPTSASSQAVEPLAAFGSVDFSHISVGGTGTAGATASPVYMVQPSDQLIEAYPGPYIAATDSFTDYFGSPTGTLVTGAAEIAPQVTTAAAGSEELPPGSGYWLAGPTGEVASFGDAMHFGTGAELKLRQRVVALVPATGYRGYWLVASDGGVFGFGGAPYLGSLPALAAKAGKADRPSFSLPITGAGASPDGKGFLLVSAKGSVYAFGDAHFAGSCTSARACPAPAVAIVPSTNGRGYWVVLANCQLVPFGNVGKIASAACESYVHKTGQRPVAAVPTPDGHGIWVLLRNGTVFALGDASLFGNWAPPPTTGPVASPAVSIVLNRAGSGAWVVFANGTVKSYGAAPKLTPQGAPAHLGLVAAAAGW